MNAPVPGTNSHGARPSSTSPAWRRISDVEALGPVLVVLSVPLMLRWVPPNRFVGFRIPSTLRNRSVWYDANALNGRHMFLLGLFLVFLEFVLPPWARIGTLRVVAFAGFATIIAVDWRTANRWERERSRPGSEQSGHRR
jgi:hypothetical protein